MRQLILLIIFTFTAGAIDVTIDINEGNRPISPQLYGRNNSLEVSGSNATTEAQKQLYREANVRFMRENSGNNCTKYNWRNGLSSHPDWYNNVYAQRWDEQAQLIDTEFENVSGMFAFPCIGWAAASDSANFNAWLHDPSYSKTTENLCGDGDINTYLIPWPADSVVGILDHWFGPSGLGLTEDKFLYWNLDNEADIWKFSHDDVITSHHHADSIIDKFLAVARKVKSINPNIKLVGPAFTGEWHFWGATLEDNLGMSFGEYFIKRFGEASLNDGVQLIDVIDLHFYFPDPQNATENTNLLQYHRIYYDEEYDYPFANGLKTSEGGWDESLTKEYLFKRVNNWVEEYFPTNNNVTVGMTENGFKNGKSINPNYIASWYASHLGTFADNGAEVFTPWYWYVGQWEVLSLFSNYHFDTRVAANSSNDSLVSAYSAINKTKDSLSVIFVNRDENGTQTVSLTLENGKFRTAESLTTLTLSNLPTTETFQSKSNNALVPNTGSVTDETSFSIKLPPLSITRVAAPLTGGTATEEVKQYQSPNIDIMQNAHFITITEVTKNSLVSICNIHGQLLHSKRVNTSHYSIDGSPFSKGLYVLMVQNGSSIQKQRFVIK